MTVDLFLIMKLLNLWACLTLIVSGLVLFLFTNLLIYDRVCFYEPYFKLAQIDVMDNKFVKNKTYYDFSKINKGKLYIT